MKFWIPIGTALLKRLLLLAGLSVLITAGLVVFAVFFERRSLSGELRTGGLGR